MEKESNRFIQQWPAGKISLENGRWGPFIRFQKKMLKLGKKSDGTKFTPEDLAIVDLEAVKEMIETQIPSAFSKKAKTVKKTATKAAKKKK